MDSTEGPKERKVIAPKVCRLKREMFPHDKDGISERVGRIAAEFTQGFEFLEKYSLAATFFGSSRCSIDSTIYKEATKLAYLLSRSGFTIITGGAAGVMEAANKGAKDAGGESVGINITLPNEQTKNEYMTESLNFHYFFSRKVMLTFASEVYIYFPGGFGTLDEFFEIATLVQTKKIESIPIILVGKEYWTPLLAWIKEGLCKEFHTVSEEDMSIYTLVDSVPEAYNTVITKVCK